MVTHILPGGLRYLTRSQPPGEVHLGIAVYDYEGANVALTSSDVEITGLPADTTVPGVYPITVTYTPDGVSRTMDLTIVPVESNIDDGQTEITTDGSSDHQIHGVSVAGTDVATGGDADSNGLIGLGAALAMAGAGAAAIIRRKH